LCRCVTKPPPPPTKAKDESLSKREKLQAIFNYFDIDNDGILNAKEFTEFVNALFACGQDEEIEEEQYPDLALSFGADPKIGIRLEHLRRAYEEENGDVDGDFEKLELDASVLKRIPLKKSPTESKINCLKYEEKKNSPTKGILKAGEVQKRGIFNTKYKIRHMQLEKLNGRAFIVYYKNKNKGHAGQILLDKAEIEVDQRNPKNWRINTNKRTFHLKSMSKEEREEWLLAVMKLCGDLVTIKGSFRSPGANSQNLSDITSSHSTVTVTPKGSSSIGQP